MFDLVRYFRQIDANNRDPSKRRDEKSTSAPFFAILQESIAKFTHLILLFNNNTDDQNESNMDSFVRFMFKTFTDHLSQPISSSELRRRVLSCLALILAKRTIEFQPEEIRLLLAIDYIGLVTSFSDNLSGSNRQQQQQQQQQHQQQQSELFDTINMFYAFVQLAFERVLNSNRADKFRLLKENSLKWSSSKMTNEMLIDTISTSIASSNAFSLIDDASLHPIMVLDTAIVQLNNNTTMNRYMKHIDKRKQVVIKRIEI